MDFKIQKQAFLTMLARTQNIVEKKETMPILVNILLEVEKGQISLSATNLEVSLLDRVSIEINEEGKALVNARNLYDIIKELDDGELTVVSNENYWIKITQDNSVFNIVGANPKDYPVFPTFKTNDFLSIDSKLLLGMIEKTIYSVANDETRYHLNGIYFEKKFKDNKVNYRMVATDGYRLSVIDREQDSNVKTEHTESVIIPRKGIMEIKKLLDPSEGPIEIAIEGTQLVVKSKDVVLLIRLIAGKYPNYKQLIPQELKDHIHLNKPKFISVLKRVSLLSHQKSKGIIVQLTNGQLEVSSNSPEIGNAKEQMDIEYSGKKIKMAFNAKFILEALNSLSGDEIDFNFTDKSFPGVLKSKTDSRHTCVVMTLRL